MEERHCRSPLAHAFDDGTEYQFSHVLAGKG